MFKLYPKSGSYYLAKNHVSNVFLGKSHPIVQDLHITTARKFPQVIALKLPTNVVDINASEMGRFSPLRERDITGPVINSHYRKQENISKIDITLQSDPHVNKYDCRGAVNLSSSMQSNVPSPFTGNHSHLGMPGSQWGQGQKYLSDHLHSAHYLTLRNEYRGRMLRQAVGTRNMSTAQKPEMSSEDGTDQKSLSTKEKLKKAVKEYGSTVIAFHVTISLISLGSCYLLISSGVDLVSLLEYLNIGEGVVSKAVGSNAGTFVVAYAIHKIFAPARMAITLTATPFIVRHLRKIGFLKKPVSVPVPGTGGGK